MKALAIDFETTGLTLHPDAKPELQPRAIEFAGVLFDERGTILKEDSWLINPGMPIEEVITKITSITNEQLADAPPFANELPRLRAIFEAADALIAHNLPFDRAILAHELKLAAALAEWRWPPIEICTVGIHEPLWGFRPKLTELYESVMGHPLEQTHRALDDVRALAAIVIEEKLLDDFAAPAPRPD